MKKGWDTRAKLPRRIIILDDYPPDEDGFRVLPEVLYIEGEIEWLEAEYARKQNPVFAWAAIYVVEELARETGETPALPMWVRDYLRVSASNLLKIDPEAVAATKMPQAIADALRLVPKRGGPGCVSQWRKVMDARERDDTKPMDWTDDDARGLHDAIDAAKTFNSIKFELRALVKSNRKKPSNPRKK